MVHTDHVQLIRKAFNSRGGIWVDLGSGDGAFTLAIRDIAGSDVKIYSVDKDRGRLQNQEAAFEEMFPDTDIHFLNKDFIDPLDIPPLDGILMANSLHYVKDQVPFLRFIKTYLKPTGKLVLVEYNTDSGNMWVPYPVSFLEFEKIAVQAEFQAPSLLATIPSSFLNEIYAAEALA